jgi:hypothetical protein
MKPLLDIRSGWAGYGAGAARNPVAKPLPHGPDANSRRRRAALLLRRTATQKIGAEIR